MRAKPVIPRTRATRDIDEAIDFLLDNAAAQVAGGFITTLERAFAHISQHPATGSPHYALALNLPGLRCWPLKRFPYLIFIWSVTIILMSGAFSIVTGIFRRGSMTLKIAEYFARAFSQPRGHSAGGEDRQQ